ncbi:MAG: NAD(P)-dependent oxidoreductase [Patescibacteria group bacterium]
MDEWLSRCRGADIICSDISGLREKYQELKDVFISLPLVGVSFLDKDILNRNNIRVSNSPGCNKDAVAEWIVGMIINLLREMPFFIGNDDLPKGKFPKATLGLMGETVLILGKGNIGNQVGEICRRLKMDVSFFERGDSLYEKTEGKEVIVNCLSANETTVGILDKRFFGSLKKNSYFVSVSSNEVYDREAMFAALDDDILAGAAIDDGTMDVGNVGDIYYQRLLQHSKIFATPHIAFNTDVTNAESSRIMTDNIEAYLAGSPINLIN